MNISAAWQKDAFSLDTPSVKRLLVLVFQLSIRHLGLTRALFIRKKNAEKWNKENKNKCAERRQDEFSSAELFTLALSVICCGARALVSRVNINDAT